MDKAKIERCTNESIKDVLMIYISIFNKRNYIETVVPRILKSDDDLK
jgi:hypothetical protein